MDRDISVLYDVCVVGAGMIGSAAARHVSKSPGLKVCLIGPKEPEKRSMDQDRDIFASHYDAGRITRVLDKDPFWCTINSRALDSYHALSQQTGIHFFEEVGNLYLDFNSPKGEFIAKVLQQAEQNNIPHEKFNTRDIAGSFPFFSLPVGYKGLFESKRSGYVNPRKLVQAEQAAARQHGCDVIESCVQQVFDSFHPDGTTLKFVQLENGDVIRSRKVLIATGAFTTLRDLLPAGLEPDVTLNGETIAKICISDADAEKLRSMPSGMVRAPPFDGHTNLIDCYFTPPIKYRDGKYYLKIGHGSDFNRRLTTSHDVKSWFCSDGNQEAVACLSRFLLDILPGITALSIEGDSCITTSTPPHRPYIDMVSPSLGVAIAGCGHAAKNCDELGRIAANMIIKGSWDYDLPAELFRFQSKPNGAVSKL